MEAVFLLKLLGGKVKLITEFNDNLFVEYNLDKHADFFINIYCFRHANETSRSRLCNECHPWSS